MKTRRRIAKKFGIVFLLFLFMGVMLYGIGTLKTVSREKMQYGITFSASFVEKFNVDWKRAYLLLLEDMNVRKIRIPVYWDEIEQEKGTFDFEDLDWQIAWAERKHAEVVLAVGRRLPRWPECHVPEWAKEMPEEELRENIISMLREIVLHFRDSAAVSMWQVENEPFLDFGECPKTEGKFLAQEIALVKELDNMKRLVLVSDSGEFGTWTRAARYGDIFGTTMYRVVHSDTIGQFTYPLPPGFFKLKAGILTMLNGFSTKIVVIEMQAEPWGKKLLWETPLAVHKQSMDHDQFLRNLEYMQRVGFPENYLWGAEWWYWAKETQNDPFYWNEVKKLFVQ